MAEIEFRITGDKAVQRMLEELPGRVQRRILEPLMREGARMLTAAAKAEAPKETGLLGQSLGASKLHVYRSGSVLFITVGVRRGFRRAVSSAGRGGVRARNPAKYLHLITGGRRAIQAARGKVFHSPNDRYFTKAKATTANPFMTRAFDAAKAPVQAMITTRAEEGIVAEATKMGSGG